MYVFYTLFCSDLIHIKKDVVETKEQNENRAFSSKVFHSFLHLGGGSNKLKYGL